MENEHDPFRPSVPLLLTVKQAAALLQLGLNRTYELARSPDFPSVRVGSSIRIPRAALERWIEERGRSTEG